MSVATLQIERIKLTYPDAEINSLTDGATLVTVPRVTLPSGGWNREKITVNFIAPIGYPMARPDCFWTDPDLRLADERMPKNTAIQNAPFANNPLKLWFSWHLAQWNPGQDNLLTYLQVVSKRFTFLE